MTTHETIPSSPYKRHRYRRPHVASTVPTEQDLNDSFMSAPVATGTLPPNMLDVSSRQAAVNNPLQYVHTIIEPTLLPKTRPTFAPIPIERRHTADSPSPRVQASPVLLSSPSLTEVPALQSSATDVPALQSSDTVVPSDTFAESPTANNSQWYSAVLAAATVSIGASLLIAFIRKR